MMFTQVRGAIAHDVLNMKILRGIRPCNVLYGQNAGGQISTWLCDFGPCDLSDESSIPGYAAAFVSKRSTTTQVLYQAPGAPTIPPPRISLLFL